MLSGETVLHQKSICTYGRLARLDGRVIVLIESATGPSREKQDKIRKDSRNTLGTKEGFSGFLNRFGVYLHPFGFVWVEQLTAAPNFSLNAGNFEDEK